MIGQRADQVEEERAPRPGAALRFEAGRRVAASPQALWPLVADTDRLNRIVGLPPVRYATRPRAGGGTRATAAYYLGPLPLARWDEPPFEWQYPFSYCVERRYHWGPLAHFRGGAQLTAITNSETEVRFWAEMTPRRRWWRPLIRCIIGPLSVATSAAQCALFEQFLAGEIDDAFPQLRPAIGWMRLLPVPLRTLLMARGADWRPRVRNDEDARRLPAVRPAKESPGGNLPAAGPGPEAQEARGAWAALAREAHDPALVERLRRHLLEAPDAAVVKMRPFELADRWGAGRRETLILFLQATTAGLLQMSWDVLCPNCRVAKASYPSLKELRPEAHCDTCDITYDAGFDRNVEVRFTVAPVLRRVAAGTFCIGGPMTTPHVVAQVDLAPGREALLAAHLEAGSYRLRSLQSRGSAIIEAGAAAPGALQVPIVVTEEATSVALAGQRVASSALQVPVVVTEEAIEPSAVKVGAGSISLSLASRAAVPVTVALERREWADTAATAALVSTLQEFRDLFSSEVLAPGIQVAIEKLALVFTDLAGSTALYLAVGQARAFRIVQDHFRLLFAAVEENRGAVVKTIGDAVMAAFPSAAAAVDAALAMQRRIRTLEVEPSIDTATLLKVGVHQGPVVAVTANERLDYFGTTVNVAARVEHACRGGEITMTAAVRDDPAVAERLGQRGYQIEPDLVHLRGIDRPVQLYRLLDPTGGTPA